MSAPQQEWIYLDEELPEIHIRELVSLEELLEKNPNFVAMSEQEIYDQLRLMFQDNIALADTYFKLHRELTMREIPEERLRAYTRHIVYHVQANRKDLGSEESDKTYFDTLNNLKKIPNYRAREQVRAELHEPFEKAGETDSVNIIRIPEKIRLRMRLLGSVGAEEEESKSIEESSKMAGDEVLRLETDREGMNILAGEFHTAQYSNSMYVHERVMATSVTPGMVAEKIVPVDIAMLPQETEEAFAIFTRALVPSFMDIIKRVSSDNTNDMRSLQVLFEKYGRRLEDIDADAYEVLIGHLRRMPIPEIKAEAKAKAKADTNSINKKASGKRYIGTEELSYVTLHKIFWDSMMTRLTIAKTDVPIYTKSDAVNYMMNTILEKPFKVEEYTPLSKQLEKLENGSMKLQEYLKEIELLRNLDERILINDFRTAMQALSGTDSQAVMKALEDRVKGSADLASRTIDPDQAEEMFGSKAFVKRYTDTEHGGKNFVPPEDGPAGDEPGHFTIEEFQEFVTKLPEDDEDIEVAEEEDELLQELTKQAKREKTQLIRHLLDCYDVLTRLQRLSNMPWNPREFIQMLSQRAPDIPDIGSLMREIDNTIPMDTLSAISNKGIDAAMELAPIEQQKAIKKTYKAALLRDDEHKRSVFLLFITYWIVHIQSLMLENLFNVNDVTNSPCKAELTGLGFPLEEGRNGRKGVMAYFVCMLTDEGHDIPKMEKMLDGYSKDEIREKIRDGFDRFTHEIEAMKRLASTEVIYQGSLQVEEADEAYRDMMSFREKKQKFKPKDLLKPYIKSLQLLPGIIEDVKERHKHILGCCYTRLDSGYMATKNLARIRDGGLSKAKRYFANEGVLLKKRPFLAYYGKPISVAEFAPLVHEKDVFLKAIQQEAKTLTETNATIANTWRQELHTITFIPERIKDMLQPDNRQILPNLYDEATRYITALFATTGSQIDRHLISRVQNMSFYELYNTATKMMFELQIYADNLISMDTAIYGTEVDNIHMMVRMAKDAIETLRMLQVPEEHSEELRALMMVMMCRITCLPGDVELNKRTITIQRSVPRGFIENLARTMSNRLNIYVELQAMPTMEEIAKRITEIREQRKVETIRRHEANPELQKIIKQARLQGIKISMDDIIPEGEAAVLDRPSQNTEDEIADLEGALDFQMDTENPDENDPDSFNDY